MSDRRPTPIPAPFRRRRRAVAALLVVPLALGVAACGDDEPTAGAAGTTSPGAEAGSPTTASTEAPPERLDVVATEFDWTGVPDSLPAGSYPLTLTNEGDEVHEIQVFQNPEGLDLQELFDLGPGGGADHIVEGGGVLVGPGESADTVLELTEGTYEVVCFIPATSDSQPHFAHGMHRTLEVG